MRTYGLEPAPATFEPTKAEIVAEGDEMMRLMVPNPIIPGPAPTPLAAWFDAETTRRRAAFEAYRDAVFEHEGVAIAPGAWYDVVVQSPYRRGQVTTWHNCRYLGRAGVSGPSAVLHFERWGTKGDLMRHDSSVLRDETMLFPGGIVRVVPVTPPAVVLANARESDAFEAAQVGHYAP